MAEDKSYVCIKEYVVKSGIPPDHVVRQGERVTLIGYLRGNPGNPVIQLGTQHKSGYAHLEHVTSVVFEDFDTHFKGE